MALTHQLAYSDKKAKEGAKSHDLRNEPKHPPQDDKVPAVAREAEAGRAEGNVANQALDEKPKAGPGRDILLERVPETMLAQLEAERKRRGLRSRAETIRVLLGEALRG